MYKEQLISVIIPAFNPNMALLERAIHSVLSQTYPEIEILICDDGSNNAICALQLAKLVEGTAIEGRLQLIRHETNRGISAARNTAIGKASGKWLVWLDADDTLDDRCIEQLYKASQGKTLVIGECLVTEGGTTSRRIAKPYFEQAAYLLGTQEDPFLLNIVAIQPQLFDHAVYDRLGGFNRDFYYAELTELFLRYLASEGVSSLQYCENALYNYDRTNEQSHTSHREELFRYRVKALQRYMNDLNIAGKYIKYIGRDPQSQMQRYALEDKHELSFQPELLCHN